MSKREQNRARTEQQILTVSRGLFLEQGFDNTTMDTIADAADVSRATLFNYFPSKAALLIALGGDMEARLVRALAHYRAKQAGTGDAIRCFFNRLADVLNQTGPLTRLLFLYTDELNELTELRAELVSLASEAQRREEWRADIAADAIADVLYAAVVSALLGSSTTGVHIREMVRMRGAAIERLVASV